MSTNLEYLTVDRFESGISVLVSDNEDVFEVKRSVLPEGAIPGTVLCVTRNQDGEVLWDEASVDEQATTERLAQAETILEDLRGRDPSGDIAL